MILLDEVDEWFMDLVRNDRKTAELVTSAIDQLATGRWRRWYEENIPLAEERYQRWLDGEYGTERT